MISELRRLTLGFLFTIAFSAIVPLHAQTSWQQAMDLNGGTVNAIMTVGETEVWAGTNVGLYYSSDKGVHWMQQGFKSATVYALSQVADTLYAGIGYSDEDGFGGVFRSTDWGYTWQKNLEGHEVWSLAIEDNRFFVGTAQQGLFRSFDAFDWTQFLNGTSVYAVYADGATVLAATDSAVFRSEDGGDTWKRSTLTARGTFYCFAKKGGTILAGGDNGLFASNDEGSTWSLLALKSHTVNALSCDSTTIYIGTDDVGLQSLVLGAQQPDSSNIGDESVYAVAHSADHVFVGTWEDGVFSSKDKGHTFDNTSIGLTASPMVLFASTDSILFVAGDGIAVSRDGGQSWKWLNLYDQVHALWILHDSLFAFCDDGIYRSDTAGQNWEQYSLANESIYCAVHDSVSYCGTLDHGVFRSDDGGQTWTATGLTNGTVNALMVYAGSVFAGMENGHVLRSDDGGANWKSVLYDSLAAIESFQVLSKSFVVGTNGDDVFFSSDNGLIWQHRLLNSILQTSVQSMCWDGSWEYAATFGNGVYASSDDAWNWEAINDNLGSWYCLGIGNFKSTLLCSTTGQGVWYRDRVAAVPEDHDITSLGSTPNPVRSWAQIQVPNPLDPRAEIQLIDVRGVEQSIGQNIDRSSANQLRVDCRSLTNGVYTLRILSGHNVYVVPLVVLH